VPDVDHSGLLEREQELTLLYSTVEGACAGAGGLVLIEGAAGIGKTRLLAAARARAADIGLPVFRARGSDLEGEFALGIVRQLFEQRVARDPDTVLTGVASYVGPVFRGFGMDGEQPAEGPSPVALEHALFWLVANLSEQSPMMLAVDDAHWADEASLRFLLYLARRIEELPVAVVLAVRPDLPSSRADLIARIAAEPSATVLQLHPLSETAARVLVRSLVGSDADDRFCEACYTSTDGNPFLLRELASALAESGFPPSQQDVRSVERLVPKAVARHVLIRLARLSPSATALARAIAVLGVGTEPHYAAALVGLDDVLAAEAIAALVAADILAVERPLAFAHPLMREVIYAELAPEQREIEHRRAARLLADLGAPAERTASQLLASRPSGDGWAVSVLRAAAREAQTRGSAASTIAYLRRALAEPPADDETAAVLLELGRAESAAALPEAVKHLTDALELSEPPISRAQIAAELTVALYYGDQRAAAATLLKDTIDRLGDVDEHFRMNLQAQAVIAVNVFLDMRPVLKDQIVGIRAQLPHLTAPYAGPLLAALAWDIACRDGTADEAAACAERGLARGSALISVLDGVPIVVGAEALSRCDRLARATSVLDALIHAARTHGATRVEATALTARAVALNRAGRLLEAEADARLALDLAQGEPTHFLRPYSLAQLATALIERGEPEAAAQELSASELLRASADHTIFALALRDTYANLLVLQGRLEDAVRELHTLEQAERDWDNRNPGWTTWRSRAAVVQHRLGEWEKAEDLAAEDVRAARAFGAPRALGIALRTTALVAREDRIDQLREAAEVLERSEARLEHARTLVELGASLRRSGHRSDARQPLTVGFELAGECGAVALADRARHELATTGVRLPGPGKNGRVALTPSELRVATLASDGLTNREIAQALYLSPKTVEMHMSHVYDKLGVRSRVRLAAALRAQTTEG
jgi:DNA-binding CsgD family transcriptional regulator